MAPAPAPGRAARTAIAAVLACICAIAAVTLLIAAAVRSTSAPAPPAARGGGYALDRPVPPMPLIAEDGRPTSLRAFRGRVVVLAPFLTLCGEVCPLTTAVLGDVQRSLDRAGLDRRAVVVEISVDPWRDSPARLRAFARLTGTRFPLLTGSRSQLHRFWRWFGVAYRRVPEGRPAATDWWTGRPLAFDVEHTDGVFLVARDGRERLALPGMPDAGGRIPPALERLLSPAGRTYLRAYSGFGWTAAEIVRDVRRLLRTNANEGSRS